MQSVHTHCQERDTYHSVITILLDMALFGRQKPPLYHVIPPRHPPRSRTSRTWPRCRRKRGPTRVSVRGKAPRTPLNLPHGSPETAREHRKNLGILAHPWNPSELTTLHCRSELRRVREEGMGVMEKSYFQKSTVKRQTSRSSKIQTTQQVR